MKGALQGRDQGKLSRVCMALIPVQLQVYHPKDSGQA